VTTARLLIRPYTQADLPAVAAIFADPRVFWWLSRPLGPDDAQRWLEAQMQEFAEYGSGMHAVVLTATSEVIGGAALKRREIDGDVVFEVGYHLARRWWGQGYATEAAGAMVAEARARGLESVIALIYPDNWRSRAVAERLGMTRGRRIFWAGLPHDVWTLTLPRASSAASPPPPPCYDS
jgi:RimJ/RimL family protein N-acetyltransferase